ncbi:MAG: hypothetical protein AB1306_03210, partial [Nitrospirota bacterium]
MKRKDYISMQPPWSIMFWIQLRQWPDAPAGLIATYENITVFLSTEDNVIGIRDGNKTYLGPKISGLDNMPWICFGLTRGQSITTLYLNGKQALQFSEDTIIFRLNEFHATAGDPQKVKAIQQDLSPWIQKRESMFKLKETTSKDYVLISSSDQEDQLRQRIQALDALLGAFHNGKLYFFDDMTANLRSLVFYKEKN